MTPAVLLAVSYLLFVAQTFGQQGRPAPNSSAKPLTVSQVWKLDAVYTDREHGVSFRYPSAWRAETAFGYWPPALTLAGSENKPIAGFGFEEGGFPRSRVVGPYSATNLEGMGIVYSAVPEENAAACEARASSVASTPDFRRVLLADQTFFERDTGTGGMSQYVSGKLYSTYRQHTCYLFETDVATASDQVLYDIKGFTPVPLHSIEAHLLDIMKSVRITAH